jgi:hypothetical protein
MEQRRLWCGCVACVSLLMVCLKTLTTNSYLGRFCVLTIGIGIIYFLQCLIKIYWPSIVDVYERYKEKQDLDRQFPLPQNNKNLYFIIIYYSCTLFGLMFFCFLKASNTSIFGVVLLIISLILLVVPIAGILEKERPWYYLYRSSLILALIVGALLTVAFVMCLSGGGLALFLNALIGSFIVSLLTFCVLFLLGIPGTLLLHWYLKR